MTDRVDEEFEAPEPKPTRPPARVSIFLGLVLMAAIGARIFLASDFAPSFLHFNVDDALYVKQADALMDGEWLGPYDHRLLTKGPGYAIFLAGNASLGIPRRFSESLFHGLACLLLFIGLRRLGIGRTWATVAFLLCLFHPVMYGELAGRVLRDGFYASLCLMVMSLALGLVAHAGWMSRLLQAIGLGLALAFAWITRGEGIWLVPALFVIACGFVLSREAGMRLRALASVALFALIPAGFVVGANELWAELNERYYGMQVKQELQEREFNRAMGSLQRVAAADWSRYEPLGPEARAKLYEASPRFASIKGWIESIAFREPHMLAENGERMAIFFSWSVRTAVLESGQAKTPADAAAYYRALHEEIEAAISDGRVEAADPRDSQYPELRSELLGPFTRSFGESAADVFLLDRLVTRPAPRVPSLGVAPAERERFERVLSQEYASSIGGIFERAALGERIRYALARAFPVLGIIALLALAFGLFRRRSLSLPLIAAASFFVAILTRLVLVAGLEASWFADIENYLIPAYLFLPALLTTSLATLLPRIPGLDRYGWGVGFLLMFALGAAAWFVIQSPRTQAILEASVEARLLGRSGSDLLMVQGAEARESERGLLLSNRGPKAEIVWTCNEMRPANRVLVIDANFGPAPVGIPWSVSWRGAGSKDLNRTLFTKGEGSHSWRIPFGPVKPKRIVIRPPVLVSGALLFERLRFEDPVDTAALSDPTEAILQFEVRGAGKDRSVLVQLEGGEADARYEIFFSRESQDPPRPFGERRGLAHIDPKNLLADSEGEQVRLILVTDEKGVGQTLSPLPTAIRGRLHAQALGPTTLSRPSVITIPE